MNLTANQLLMRSLRDMHISVWSTYDPVNHAVAPGPNLAASFPEKGIDLSAYRGESPLRLKWRAIANNEEVRDELKDDISAVLDILDKIDGKNGDFVVTAAEWSKAHPKPSDEAKDDLDYLLLFKSVSDYLILEKAPNVIVPERDYPELIQARADAKKTIGEKDGQISVLEASLNETSREASLYQQISYGLGGSLGFVALVLGVRELWRGRQRPAPATGPVAPQERDTAERRRPAGESGPRVAADTTRPAAEEAAPRPAADDIADALAEVDRAASPASAGRPGGTLFMGGVTPENVVINGPSAEPVSGIDPDVIRAQIALTYRNFLSQAARDALLAGRSLPPDTDLIHSVFAEKVDEMVDKVMSDYHRMNQDALAEMWRTQREDRGYIARRGVPQRVLMSVCGEFIAVDAARAQSPFAGGSGADIRSEGERRSGETDFMTRGLREAMRHLVRK